MKIELHDVGKKFRNNWIFRNLNISFPSSSRTAILGSNGSGKSTLLQLLSASNLPSEGHITYSFLGDEIKGEDVYRHLTFAAPYTELFNQLTLNEMVKTHMSFKPFFENVGVEEAIEKMYLKDATESQISVFSSGMRQRLKLGLAILSESDLLLLDEPCSNLDEKGRTWYKEMISEYGKQRTIVVCSNRFKDEYEFCTDSYHIGDERNHNK